MIDSRMTRRSAIGLGAGAVAAGLGGLLGLSPATAHAFGVTPAGEATDLLESGWRPDNVLEVFLFGGVSPYESFYCVEEFGADASDPSQWNLFLRSGDLQATLDECALDGEEPLVPFAEDADGNSVRLGPFTVPLRARPDFVDRLRTVVVAHEAFPHEIAVPLSLTGRSSALPTMASIGSHVERYFSRLDGGQRRAPYSYVLLPPSPIQIELSRGAVATGLHPGTARPLGVRLDGEREFVDLLQRDTLGDLKTAHDDLVRFNIERARQRLTVGGTQLRASRLEELAASARLVESAEYMSGVLSDESFTPLHGESCGTSTSVDSTTMSLRLAARLLRHPEVPAKYVCVVDGGFGRQENAGGYDSHNANCPTQSRNLLSTLAGLSEIVNRPGESDPNKLDLDKTLIVLNTEFGRTPYAEGDRGRGHWPFGYPVMLLGGPIKQRAVVGALGPDARATASIHPAQHRIAVLLALGIWPFGQESFNVSDVPNSASNLDAAKTVLKEVIGVGA